MPDEPAGWLVTVANNLVRDERRLSSRRLRLLTEQPRARRSARPPTRPPTSSGPSGSAPCGPRSRPLTLRDRQALLLRHAGYSYREIAAALGLAETSVGTTLVRASHAFRAAFQELHGAPD